MASDSSSNCQDEKAALLEADSEKEGGLEQQCLKRSDTKLTLYHWTQSFNSQKVSTFDVSAPRCRGQLLVSTLYVAFCIAGINKLSSIYNLFSFVFCSFQYAK